MPLWLRQLGALLWKDFKIQYRSPVWTVFELLPPIIFAILVAYMRSVIEVSWSESRRDTLSFPVPTAQYLCPLNQFGYGRGANLTLLYAPESRAIDDVMDELLKKMEQYIKSPQGSAVFARKGFDTGRKLEEYAVSHINKLNCSEGWSCSIDILGGIVFSGDVLSSGLSAVDVSTTIRMPTVRGRILCFGSGFSGWFSDAPLRPSTVDSFRGDVGGVDNPYHTLGFTLIQHALADVFVSQHSAEISSKFSDMTIAGFPLPGSYSSIFMMLFSTMFPILMVLSFAVPAVYTARHVTAENEAYLKEYMKAMGLSSLLFWIAHFITAYLKMLLIMFVVVMVLCFLNFKPGSPGTAAIFHNSDPSLILVYFMLFGLAIVWFTFAVAAVAQTGSRAAKLTLLIWIGIFVPYMVFMQTNVSGGAKMAWSLLMNTGFGFAMQLIAARENSGSGVRWSTIGDGSSLSDSYSLGSAMLMLCVDVVIYIAVVWYVDGVWPGQGGVARPLWFPFQPSYWSEVCCCSCKSSADLGGAGASDSTQHLANTTDVPDTNSPADKFQPYEQGTPIAVQLFKLTKRFGVGGGGHLAVDQVSMSIAERQCFAVLGPNGAGKSTTMAMLAGMLTPTMGTATVLGHDIRDDLAQIRRILGLCPQYNVLFDKLTVIEHLQFYCMLKGVPTNAGEMRDLLVEVGLCDDSGKARESARAATLSGGQKRKLSVCVALTGDPHLVILDEPTAGIDVASRQRIWKLLQKQRKLRTMILTTHYMDEADVLGDRIAIIAKGKLRTCGQPMFLKRRFGAGYLLSVAFSSGVMSSTMAEALLKIVAKHVAEAKLRSATGQEATFLLPDDQIDNFPTLLEDLETRQAELNVDTFGVSRCSLEDVFLRVAEEAELEEMEVETSGSMRQAKPGGVANAALNESDDESARPAVKAKRQLRHQMTLDPEEFTVAKPLTGAALFLHQYLAMLRKRLDHWVRSWWSFTIFLFLAWLAMLLAFSAGTLVTPTEFSASTAPLKFSTSMKDFDRGDSQYPVYFADDKFEDSYKSSLASGGIPRSHMTATKINSTVDPVRLMFNDVLEIYGRNKGGDEIDNQTIADRFSIGGGYNDMIAVFHQSKLMHALPISLAAAHSALLRMAKTDFTFSVTAQPLPLVDRGDSYQQEIVNMLNELLPPAVIAIVFAVAVALLVGWFPLFIAKERHTGMKHLQLASGASPLVFWIGHLTFDLFLYIVFSVGVILFGLICGKTMINWAVFLLVQLLFGLAVLPTMYFIPFCIKSHTKCSIMAIVAHLCFGVIPFAVYFGTWPIRFFSKAVDDQVTNFAADWELAFTIISPTFNVVKAMSDIYTWGTIGSKCPDVDCSKQGDDITKLLCCNGAFDGGILGWLSPGLGRTLVALAIQAVAWFIVLLLIDYDLVRPVRVGLGTLWSRVFGKSENVVVVQDDGRQTLSAQTRDLAKNEEQVAERALHLGQGDTGSSSDVEMGVDEQQPPVVAYRLVKTYGTKRAVDNVSFTVRPSECFGLLGENGAGKTSTFKMITGETLIEGGAATVAGIPVRSAWRRANQYAGYCPQFDATMGRFGGGSVVALFARIRGIPANKVAPITRLVMQAVGLDKDMDKAIKSYSGGMKRRLSLAVALVAAPPVLLLDEPTAGVDPEVRRRLWRIVSDVCQSRRTCVLLTSHNMDECDALCNRLAIMAQGKVRALGSPQLLKSSYGAGCSLYVRIRSFDRQEDQVAASQAVANDICATFENVTFKCTVNSMQDAHENLLSCTIPTTKLGEQVRWSTLFAQVQQLVGRHADAIDDYTLSQASLEQMFIAFCSKTGGPQPSGNMTVVANAPPTRDTVATLRGSDYTGAESQC